MYKTPRRQEVVDFTQPFLKVHATMIMLKEEYGGPYDINTIHDLVTSGHPYGTQAKGMIRKHLHLSNDSLYLNLHKEMQNSVHNVFTPTNEEGLAKVRRDKDYIYILPDNIAHYMVLRQPCDLKAVGHFLLDEDMSLVVDKNSNLLSHLNHAMRALNNAGVLSQLRKKWWNERSECKEVVNRKTERSSNHKTEKFKNIAISRFTFNSNSLYVLCIVYVMFTISRLIRQ